MTVTGRVRHISVPEKTLVLEDGAVISLEDVSYIAIDLKSFYASAECADRKLDPLTTNLVVADQSRPLKWIEI